MQALVKYSKTMIRFHWVMAVLILAEWPLGKFGINSTGSTSEFVNAAHIWLGLIVFVLTILRIITMLRGPRVEDLPMPSWEKWLFKINHVLLYVGMLGASATGLGMLIAAKSLPPFTDDLPMGKLANNSAGELHEAPSNLLMFMFVMHVVGVIYYQVLHGRTLRRMGIPAPK